MTDNWTDRLAGARMQVDQQFQSTLEGSEFTNQEWGLIMTAVEFEVKDADDPDGAHLVADREKIRQIIPELDNIQREMGGAARPVESAPDGSGLFGRLRQYLGFLSDDSSDTPDQERLAAAKVLVDEYTEQLEAYLREQGRWEEIRQAAAEQP
ncbi:MULTISPECIES: DUF5799 family protein [Salinibaculum]|uniref:DUF5799 family protein n=1 Tax=Salinibaculum TaxID=2732368 RepID=UPI0030D39AE9